MIRLAAAVALLAAILLFVTGVLALAASIVTGNFAYVNDFMTAVLVIPAAVLGLAVLVPVTAWLLLSYRSPIPRVRAYWTRHLTPVRAASPTARSAATSQEGTS